MKIPWPWGNVFDGVITGFTAQINTLRGTKLKYWSRPRHYLITETLKQVQVILTTNVPHFWALSQVGVNQLWKHIYPFRDASRSVTPHEGERDNTHVTIQTLQAGSRTNVIITRISHLQWSSPTATLRRKSKKKNNKNQSADLGMSLGETSNPDGWKHTRKPESINLHWYKVKFKAHQDIKCEKSFSINSNVPKKNEMKVLC